VSPEDTDAPVVHRRTIEIESRDRGNELDVFCTLRDERPWSPVESRRFVHDMELRIKVRMNDLVITSAVATMQRFPHAECTNIEPAFADLVGMQVGRGFSRAVQERFGGPRGCAHLTHLATIVAPVVIQSLTSARAHADPVAAGGIEQMGFLRNSCHLWTEDGPGAQKIALGWRPNMVNPEYPFPAVDEIRRRSTAAE